MWGSTFHVTVDDYYTMPDVTRTITRDYGHPFAYYEIPAFVAEMNRRATREDPIYPLLDFFNRSHPKIAAMQHKRYDNSVYRDARERSGVGRREPELDDTVAFIVESMQRDGIVPLPAGKGSALLAD